MTKARDIAALIQSNGKIANSDLDISFENITDTGTEGTKIALGTTGQRGSTQGQIRFNSTIGLAEYYTGTAFKSIDSPPTISSIDDTEVDSAGGGNQTIVITGSSFNSGATVTFVGASGTNFNASTVTVDSATQITAVAPKASFLNAQEPYGVKVTNSSGLAATLASQINVDNSPTWSTASGTIYSGNDLTDVSVTVSATDADGDTVTYAVQSGSLPAGTSLNSSTGAITGTPTGVSSDTTSTFTLRATAGGKTADRQFSIVIRDATIQAFTYTGSDQTWTVPSGVTAATIQAWGAGGGSDSSNSGQYGAAGGYATGILTVSAGDVMKIVVGQGGPMGAHGGSGGSGGGYSGIFLTSVSQSNARLIAGGGGGAGDGNMGGEGGGTTGTDGREDSSNNNHGRGGTQSAGGDKGNISYSSQSGILPTSGSALQGGNGGGDAGGGNSYTPAAYGGGGQGGHEPGGSQGGGGGGGGYYGGGGGDGNAFGNNNGQGAGGGGGSSYIGHANISSGSTTSGSNQTSGGASAANYASGIGNAGTNTAGNNGRIVITF